MADSIDVKVQKKVLRTLIRLKHSVNADRELDEQLAAFERVGTQGAVPRLEASLTDLIGDDS